MDLWEDRKEERKTNTEIHLALLSAFFFEAEPLQDWIT